jgi:hypothetical protein
VKRQMHHFALRKSIRHPLGVEFQLRYVAVAEGRNTGNIQSGLEAPAQWPENEAKEERPC